MRSNSNGKRVFWTEAQTKALLQTYLSRLDDFTYTCDNRNVYSKVLRELIYRHSIEPHITITDVQVKMNELYTAYQRAVRNNNRSDPNLEIAPYIPLLDAIFIDHTSLAFGDDILDFDGGITQFSTIAPFDSCYIHRTLTNSLCRSSVNAPRSCQPGARQTKKAETTEEEKEQAGYKEGVEEEKEQADYKEGEEEEEEEGAAEGAVASGPSSPRAENI